MSTSTERGLAERLALLEHTLQEAEAEAREAVRRAQRLEKALRSTHLYALHAYERFSAQLRRWNAGQACDPWDATDVARVLLQVAGEAHDALEAAGARPVSAPTPAGKGGGA